MLLTRPRHKLSSILLALGMLAMVGSASATTYVYRTMISAGNQVAVCTPGSLTESTVNASLSIQVPAQGCKTITVILNGAAGGNGANGGIGGSGGAITFQLPASTYTGNWTGVVGQGGFGQTTAYQGGAGGGYTSVSFNGVLLGTAGGGGGAGDGADGGDGGLTATSGAIGTSGGSNGGAGATDSGPGAGGSIGGYNAGNASNPGAGMAGGYAQGPSTGAGGAGVGDGGIFQDDGTYGNGAGGGGGGGYFGGGGGTQGGGYQSGGGGGGGSDFAISSASGVTDTVGGGAPAGTSTGATGNNGSITVSWQ